METLEGKPLEATTVEIDLTEFGGWQHVIQIDKYFENHDRYLPKEFRRVSMSSRVKIGFDTDRMNPVYDQYQLPVRIRVLLPPVNGKAEGETMELGGIVTAVGFNSNGNVSDFELHEADHV